MCAIGTIGASSVRRKCRIVDVYEDLRAFTAEPKAVRLSLRLHRVLGWSQVHDRRQRNYSNLANRCISPLMSEYVLVSTAKSEKPKNRNPHERPIRTIWSNPAGVENEDIYEPTDKDHI